MRCWMTCFGNPFQQGRDLLEDGSFCLNLVRSLAIDVGDNVLLYYNGGNKTNPQCAVGVGYLRRVNKGSGCVEYDVQLFEQKVPYTQLKDMLSDDAIDRLKKARLVQNRLFEISCGELSAIAELQ